MKDLIAVALGTVLIGAVAWGTVAMRSPVLVLAFFAGIACEELVVWANRAAEADSLAD